MAKRTYRVIVDLDVRRLGGLRPARHARPRRLPHERLSTTDLSGSGNRVSRALDLIRRKATEGLTVAAVVKQIGGSERLLEKNFSEVVGHSICREIQDTRLDKVKDLLSKTDLPIDTIAARCAFGNGNYLKNLFLKRFGQTMSTYRSANR